VNRRLQGLALTLLAVATSAGAQEGPLDGRPIVRIVVIRHDLFDTEQPPTDSWPYRWANAIHIVTKDGFVRRMLLFEEGDLYFERDAAESARILRATDFLNPVDITAREVEGGVEVTVETRDQWTLEVGAQAGVAGKRSDYGLNFTETNFLGWGREISVEYSSDPERSAWTYSLYDPNILGTRWRARVKHEESSHGGGDLIRVQYPFYSLATPRSSGLELLQETDRDYLYSESEIRVYGQHEVDSLRLWGGLRLPVDGDVTRRLIAGWTSRKDAFSDWILDDPTGEVDVPEPPDRTVSGPTFGYQRRADRYRVVTGFRAWSKQEDVALGPDYDLGLTVSLPELGGDVDRLLFDGTLSTALEAGPWLLVGNSWFEGRLDQGDMRNWVVGFQAIATQLGPRGLQARLMVESSYELDRERQLALGADTGLRGWDPDYFDGTGRAVANLQWRHLIKEDILHLFSLGFVVFADAGTTWGARVGPGADRVHANVGVGLLADLTHIGLARLLRIEVGFPDDGTGYTLTVTTTPLF